MKVEKLESWAEFLRGEFGFGIFGYGVLGLRLSFFVQPRFARGSSM